PRAERMTEMLFSWLRGDRFGPSHKALCGQAISIAATLTARYDMMKKGQLEKTEDSERQTTYYWLEYQDLSGYVLLGDPAAALPGSKYLRAQKAAKASPAAPVIPTFAGAEPDLTEPVAPAPAPAQVASAPLPVPPPQPAVAPLPAPPPQPTAAAPPAF